MSLKVSIDSSGTPQQDFYQLRNRLVSESKKFDSSTLPLIPYNQLYLTIIGTAGIAMCSLDLVQEEKRQRRQRFLLMDENTLISMKNYLLIEQMWEDVCFERIYSEFPRWDDLTERQKIWLKLTCIANHIDSPQLRITEVIDLLKVCEKTGSLPIEVASNFASKFRDILRLYPLRISGNTFRNRIIGIASNFSQFLPQEETKQIEDEQVQGYSCTSDCHRVRIFYNLAQWATPEK